ncbi:MAG: hypothetical protein R2801_02990 [Chitinophagales bacterium]
MNKLFKSFLNITLIQNQNNIIQNYNEDIKKELADIIDIIYYLKPGCHIPNFPYIYTLWDIGHLSMYAFPEVSMNGVFEIRKKHHELFPQKALMVFCESESGKKEALKYLGLNKNRVQVVPMFPSKIISKEVLAHQPKEIKKRRNIHSLSCSILES